MEKIHETIGHRQKSERTVRITIAKNMETLNMITYSPPFTIYTIPIKIELSMDVDGEHAIVLSVPLSDEDIMNTTAIIFEDVKLQNLYNNHKATPIWSRYNIIKRNIIEMWKIKVRNIEYLNNLKFPFMIPTVLPVITNNTNYGNNN